MNQEIAIYTTDREYAKSVIDGLIEEYPKSDIIRYYTKAIVKLKKC